MRIGIDLGNVLVGGDTEWFGSNFLNAPIVDGGYDAIVRLVNLGHELFIVSKAYPRNQVKSKDWLYANGFNMWISDKNKFFVLRREDKTIVCDNLFLDLMIDDRSDIIDHINENSKGTVGYLFTTWEQFWDDYDKLLWKE